jgi:radical SAM superfamily enzyme with C-terminal helix-hairpin-helix motif
MEKKFRNRYLKKNKRLYWKWRNDIRQNIDFPLLQRLVPEGTVLRDIYSEIYDGKTTFGRQIGTYPLIVGIKGRIKLRESLSICITAHMLRSVTGRVVDDLAGHVNQDDPLPVLPDGLHASK